MEIHLEYCGEICKKLQDNGKKVEIYLEDDKLKKKLNYANKLGIPKVILIGEDEVASGEIKIKDMISGNESILNYNQIIVE